jgi:hypothetical protein
MRIEMNGMVIEGTVEELREIGVKFPVDEEVAESRRLTVGDYARVVANDTGHRAKVGDIVKIVEDEHDHHPYRCEKLNGEDVLWFKEHELAPVTEEEIAQAKAELAESKFEVGDYVVALPESDEEYGITNTEMKLGKVTRVCSDGEIIIEIVAHEDVDVIGEDYVVEPKYFRKATDDEITEAKEKARWAKIGRKPGEFKKGDIVRYLGGAPTKKGELVEVYEDTSGTTTKIKWVDDYGVCTERNDDLELVTPVEQRFDIAAEGVHQ